MVSVSTPLTFAHPELTPINGEPTSSSLSLLQKELYANARQIYSTRGGGNHGHLRIMLTDVAYITRTNAIFIIPVHPGVAPVHAAGATAPIAETIRLFNQSIGYQLLYQRATAALKQQVILAVENRYLFKSWKTLNLDSRMSLHRQNVDPPQNHLRGYHPG